MFKFILLMLFVLCTANLATAQNQFETDNIPTTSGDLKITFIGHGTLVLTFNEKIIHLDPYGRLADYLTLPKADIILVTHEHGDHFDLKVIKTLRTEKTSIVLTKNCAKDISDGIVLMNWKH